MADPRTSLDHGLSHIVWVYRNRGSVPLGIGWLRRDRDGAGRAGRTLRLRLFRHLMPGRYDLVMARYGKRWPVTLEPDPETEDAREMSVTGRVPI